MDLFRILINEMPSELCFLDQNSEEVHILQSPDEKKYWCYYPHWLRYLVSPIWGIFHLTFCDFVSTPEGNNL